MTHTLRVDSLSLESQLLGDRLKSSWELESFGITDSDHSVYDDFGSYTLSPDSCSMSLQAFRQLYGDVDIMRLRVIKDDKKESKENDLPVVSQEQRKRKEKGFVQPELIPFDVLLDGNTDDTSKDENDAKNQSEALAPHLELPASAQKKKRKKMHRRRKTETRKFLATQGV